MAVLFGAGGCIYIKKSVLQNYWHPWLKWGGNFYRIISIKINKLRTHAINKTLSLEFLLSVQFKIIFSEASHAGNNSTEPELLNIIYTFILHHHDDDDDEGCQ